jgi:exodeoxyribonuclease VII large subunit
VSPKQLDIFSAPAKADSVSDTKPKKKRVKRAPRRVKKAPMLVDAYRPEKARVEVEVKAKVETKAKTPPEPEIEASPSPRIFTVSEITDGISNVIDDNFVDVWVTGEVTDFRNRTGRHFYFALKDADAKIRAVIFGAGSRRLGFDLEDGMELVCHGRINIYAPQGSYSLIVDHCEPKGLGALQKAFEQLKKKLHDEGLFNPERKQPIPFLPKRIGVITSPTGAAIRDIVNVLTRRYPNVEVLLHPARVQGEGSAIEVADAIERMNDIGELDVLIVGRGGGSIEDLWAFNEEVVARAIAASKIPIISAVGHEIDFTIADFVADARAPTPSAAAEIAVPVVAELIDKLGRYQEQMKFALKQIIENRRQGISALVGRLGDPRRRLDDLALRVDGLRERVLFAVTTSMDTRASLLDRFTSNLAHLSPLGILAKGYSVVEGPDGHAVIDSKSLSKDDELKLRFHEGTAKARVTDTSK